MRSMVAAAGGAPAVTIRRPRGRSVRSSGEELRSDQHGGRRGNRVTASFRTSSKIVFRNYVPQADVRSATAVTVQTKRPAVRMEHREGSTDSDHQTVIGQWRSVPMVFM